MSSFIPKYFLQNLKNSLVAKQTIVGGTLGHPVDSLVAFGDRATIFQQRWWWVFSDYKYTTSVTILLKDLNLKPLADRRQYQLNTNLIS